jgi:guanylate kinase
VGGLHIKKEFGDRALAIFVAPPTIDILHERLISRGTDSPEMIQKRIAKADLEMTFSNQFDHIIVNDNLEKAKKETERLVRAFLDEN